METGTSNCCPEVADLQTSTPSILDHRKALDPILLPVSLHRQEDHIDDHHHRVSKSPYRIAEQYYHRQNAMWN